MRELQPSSATPSLQPIALRSMFWRPDYLVASDWLEHLPVAFWLVEALQPRVLVEVAVPGSPSYFAFCQAVERLALDTRCFTVLPPAAGEGASAADPAAIDAFHDHNDARYAGFSRLLDGDFDEALARFGDGTVDLLHLDLRAGYGALVELMAAWRPKLSSAAVLVLHRTHDRGRRSGAHRLLADLGGEHPVFEFSAGEGLAVVGLGADHGPMLERLFAAAADDIARRSVHEVFSRLGRACVDGFHARSSQQRARTLMRDLEDRQRRLDEASTALERHLAELRAREDELAQARMGLQLQGERQAIERAGQEARLQLLQEARDELRQQLQQAQARVDGLTGERAEALRDAAAETADLRARLDAAIARIAELEAERETLQARARETVADPAVAAERDSLREALTALRAERDAARAESDALSADRDDMQAALAAAQAERDRARDALATAGDDLAARERALAEAQASLAARDAALADSRNQTARLAELIGERDAELVGLRGEAAQRQRQEGDRAAQLATLRAATDTLQAQYDDLAQELAQLRNERVDVDAELARVREALAAAASELDHLRGEQAASETELARLRSERAGFADELERLRGERARLDAELARLRDGDADRDGELAAVRAELSTHVAIAENRQRELGEWQQRADAFAAELEATREAHAAEIARLRSDGQTMIQRLAGSVKALREEQAAHAGDLATRDRTIAELQAQLAAQTAEQDRRAAETATLTRMLMDTEHRARQAQAGSQAADAARRHAEAEAAAQREQLQQREAHVAALEDELARLRGELLALRSGGAPGPSSGGGWLTAPLRAMVRPFRPGETPPASGFVEAAPPATQAPVAASAEVGPAPALADDLAELRACELFDPDWYLTAYPDVAAAGVDPAEHYLRQGAAAGRDPGPGFATSAYLQANPEAARSGMNPLLHWARIGRHEGRAPR